MAATQGAPAPSRAADLAVAPSPASWDGAHVVGTGIAEGAPVLWLAQDGAVRGLRLRGPMALHASGPRVCIGSWADGRRVPCPAGRLVGSDAQCLACSGLEHPECVFEPLCQGNPAACACEATFRGVEHLVYCAFYGTLPKVGLTQARRVGARLREQGADLYFVVARGLDRPAARALERSISSLHRIPEYRSHRETLPQLARPVPWDVVEERARALADRLGAQHPVEAALHRIDDYPVRQPLPARPRRVATYGTHHGEWLGAKGNHIFYAEAPRRGRLDAGLRSVAALKRSDLVGLFLRAPE